MTQEVNEKAGTIKKLSFENAALRSEIKGLNEEIRILKKELEDYRKFLGV